MKNKNASSSNKKLIGFLWVAGLLFSTGVSAQSNEKNRYFDIRLSDDKPAVMALQRLQAVEKSRQGPPSISPALKDDLEREALRNLSAQVPGLDLLKSVETGYPEIVGVRAGGRLTDFWSAPAEQIARSYLERHSWIYGLSPEHAAALETDADYSNPAGNISWVRLTQRVHDLPVFRGEITIAITPNGEVLRSVGQIASFEQQRIPAARPVLDAEQAILAAAPVIDMPLEPGELFLLEQAADGHSSRFEGGPFADVSEAELVYFPLGPDLLHLAWSMTLWGEIDAYYILVSALDGELLFLKNITEHQTQSATFEVYRNANAYIDVADSPAPITPGPVDPALDADGALLTRAEVTLIGNEGDLSFNDNGWISDGSNGTDGHTDGNNVEAGLDIDGSNGVDAPVAGTGRVFSSSWNPPPGDPAPGDDPTDAAARYGAVVQMFYITNRYHDEMYKLGFTEAARNFQHLNFGRGGVEGDRISAEGQDSSGTNNANFSTPLDGGRGRMQMYRFTAPTPDRDGTADADIIIHELTHGTSDRLHGNASGLGTNMARGMGEGWSDFYAHALLSEPSDPIAGIYTTGAYSTRDILGPGYASSYYGIRRFPKAVMAFTGGPGNRPHNPLTFADLNDGCDLSDGPFPPESWSPTCDQVHNAGEIWSSALWEVRALMIDRLGFAAGNERVLQVVTDGMKLSPLNPTFLQARDAIIAAASVFGPDDVADVREGFRIRGMGFSAQVLNLQPANVVEAFDYPNVQFSSPITVQNMSCSDADRNPLPGETIAVSVEVANSTGETMSNVGAILENANTVDYGTIPHGQTVSKKVFYTIPPGVACGTEISLDVQLFSDVGNAALLENDFLVGEAPVSITSFTNGTAFDIPLAPNTSGPASLYPSPITVAGIVDPVVGVRVTLNDLSHTWPDDIDILLVGPNEETFIVLSDAFGSDDLVNATFMFDDAAAEAAPDFSPAGAGPFRPTNHGSSDIFDAPAPSGPYGEPEPAGVDTFASVFTGDDVNGEWNLYIDDDAGADSGSMGAGWTLDILTSQPAECLPCATPYCQPVMDVSNQFIMSELVVDACQALNSSHFSILDPGGAVEFRAGTSIMLGTGFTVEAGSTFKAEIVP